MEPVDIPADLIERLEQERIKADLDNKLRLHVSNLRQMFYFLEEDVAAFHQYSLKEDFVSERAFRVLNCAKGCHCVGFQIALAAELGVYPHQVEIWTTMSDNRQKLRLLQRMSPKTFVKHYDLPFFVRVLGPCDTLEVSPALIEGYSRLQEEEATFLDEIRDAFTLAGVELPYDPSEGCGIGRGQFTVKRANESVRDHLLQKYNALLDEAVELVSDIVLPVPKTHQVIFFKVFDAEHILPHPCIGDSDQATDSDARNCPIVYLGSEYVDESDSIDDINTTVFKMLSSCFGAVGKGIPEDWVNMHYFLMALNGDITCLSTETREQEELDDGDVICCVPGPRVDTEELRKEQESLAYNALNSFITYEINKKTFRIGYCSYIPSQVKYFKRACGLWTASQCDLPVLPIPSDDEEEYILSLAQSCELVVRDVANLVQNTGMRLVVGKEYVSHDRHMYLPLPPNPDLQFSKYLRNFVKLMNSHDLYSLQVACLPLDPLPDSSKKRCLEFILVDQRMREQRREWLDRDIYRQAAHLYNMQKKDILSMVADGQDRTVQVGQLRPVSGDISWPYGVTPVADEFVSDSHLYLSFDVDIGVTVHDIMQDVRRNIVLADPTTAVVSDASEEDGVGPSPRKRPVAEVTVTSVGRNVRSRAGSGNPINETEQHDEEKNDGGKGECMWANVLYPAEFVSPDTKEPFIIAFSIMDHSIYSYLHCDHAMSTIRRNW